VRISVASARYGHVDGKNERPYTELLCRPQRLAHEGAIANHIKLKPEFCVARADGDLRKGAKGHSREGERDACFKGCFSGLHFAPAPVHSGDADRTQDDGQRLICTKKSRLEVDLAHARENPLLEIDFREIGDVPTERNLAIRSALGVIE
jgi:hypothetical protein